MRVQLIGHLGVPGGWLRGLLGQALCLLEVGLPEAPGPALIVPVSYHSLGHSQRLKNCSSYISFVIRLIDLLILLSESLEIKLDLVAHGDLVVSLGWLLLEVPGIRVVVEEALCPKDILGISTFNPEMQELWNYFLCRKC